MKKKSKKKVPELRFAEFKGDWTLNKLREVSSISSGTTPLRSNESYFDKANIPWVKTTDLNNSEILITEECISEIALQETSIRKNPIGSILIAMYGGFNQIGRTGLLKIEAATNQALSVVVPQENVNSYFLLHFFNRNVKKWRTYAASSRKDPNITSKDVGEFPITFPEIAEQEKIASFLGTIDTRLTQLRRKRELLQTYKRGVMQKIFSQEVRFKGDDRSAFPDWEERKLKSIATINPSSKHFPDRFLYIDLERVDNGVLGEPELLDKENAPSRAQRVLEKGDILYQTVRPYQRNNLCFSLDGDYVASTGYAQLRARENPQFLYQLIHSDNFVDKVIARCTGTSYPAINSSDLADISILLPDSVKEQAKIADFLMAIDRKIEAISQQIDRTEQFKKGLLQKMFV